MKMNLWKICHDQLSFFLLNNKKFCSLVALQLFFVSVPSKFTIMYNINTHNMRYNLKEILP